MSEQLAGSSPATEDVFQGQTPTFDEFSHYRQTGELPARFKPAETAEPAPAPTSEDEQSDIEPGTDAGDDAQEQPKPKKHLTAEDRKAQLKAKVEELWQADEPDHITIAKLEATITKIEEGQKRKTAPAPVAQPQQAQEAPKPQATRPMPTPTGNGPDGKPYATYEDYIHDHSRWVAEQTIAEYERRQQEARALEQLRHSLDESRARYEDADDVIFPAAEAIREAQIPLAIKEVFSGSEFFTDLCYVVGSDPKELQSFLHLAQTNPRAALAKVFEYERGIREELSKADDATKAPEKKQTAAPKPPTPVGGGSSRAFDVSDESLTPEQWARKRNEQLARKKA